MTSPPTSATRGLGSRVRRALRGAVRFGLPLLVVVAVVVLVRTWMFSSKQIHVPAESGLGLDGRAIAERVGQAVRFQTISHQESGRLDADAFRGLHRFLEGTYPKTHAAVTREVVGDFSLLYTWVGTDASLPPIVLMAHQDVVPVESPTAWKHAPFGGEVVDGAVWGRGAIDCKGPLIGIFEAIERLLIEGWQPRRTVYLAFGHDEEVGGRHGAAAIAALLGQRGVRPEFVLDEGGAITDGVIGGMNRPVAVVGIAEKGYLSLELKVTMEGGHSSMPPPETAVDVLAAALRKLHDDPFPAQLTGVARQTLNYLGPEMPFGRRLAIANLWLFSPIVERQLLASPATAATLRTTMVPTILEAGVKDNVLPREARAIVNLRILPGDTTESAERRVGKVIADARVRVTRSGAFATEASPVADTNSTGFRTIQRAIAHVSDAVVAPVLVTGGTDSRHFAPLTPNVFRFIPLRLTPQDLATIHGDNERLTFVDCTRLVHFYESLLKVSQ